jgi:undecaprenyl-phosphate 4-deoxy-4-formamido-L-arabinose transferase
MTDPKPQTSPAETSVVVPVLNEEANLPELVRRVAEAFGRGQRTFELVVVLDGCTDRSLELLLEMRRTRPWIRVVELAHGVGQHGAVGVGLGHARGTFICTIDADLQNPPEALPDIVARLEGGAQAVGTTRRGRRDPLHRSMASRLFATTLRLVGGRHVMADPGCMLRGWRRGVIDAFLAEGVPALYIPTQLNRFADSYEEFAAGHDARKAGESRYDALRLARLFLRTVLVEVAPGLLAAPAPRIAAIFEGDAE